MFRPIGFQSTKAIYFVLMLCSSGNQDVVRLAILVRKSITGTSAKTPTMVTRTAGEEAPNKVMATATESSKKLEAPIMPAGAAMSWGNLSFMQAR